MKIDLDQIRSLLSVVGQTDITELTIESGDEKITVKKGAAVIAGASHGQPPMEVTAQAPSRPVATAQAVPPQAAKVDNNGSAQEPPDSTLVAITSPMVGTFYRASGPNSAPFVDIGTKVSVGQTVCIIEAMKLMNDLPAEISGKVVKVMVDNGTTVEFGQTLFLVDPKG